MDFLTYKDKPLVRKGNELYYGDMAEKYVVRLDILSTTKVGDIESADRVKVTLMKSDLGLNPADAIVKSSEKKGLYEAMDIGAIWLERELKK